MKYCEYCGENMSDTESHHFGCRAMSSHTVDETFDLATSVAVAAITDSAAIGALAGGNLMGAIVGDFLVDGSLGVF